MPIRLLTALLLLLSISSGSLADNFLTDPGKLAPDQRFKGGKVYFADNLIEVIPRFDSIMVDEPVLFLADDSPYKGFKASDLAAVAQLFREGFSKGLQEQPVAFGNFKIVDKPGPSVLYLRTALRGLYIRKNKRNLLEYTPVGAVVKEVGDLTSEAIDKSTLVELSVEAEVQDSTNQEVLFAGILERGHRKAKHSKEAAAGWDMASKVAETMGRRLACRLNNGRLAAGERVDCIETIPVPSN